MPQFKIGTDDFSELINQGGYFVDKSSLISQVLHGDKVTLLPRPRRFGKTLNMSMLRYFFEQSEEDRSYLFDGLSVADDPDTFSHQGQYPAIYISLKDVKADSWKTAKKLLDTDVSRLYKQHHHVLSSLDTEACERFHAVVACKADESVLSRSLKDLINYLYLYHKRPVVVLIDEYDSPVIEAWNQGYYDEMISFMRSWLGAGLKHENSPALFRAVVTGILRVAKESVFSGLNNLKVASSLSSGPFADKFGFTEKEVEHVLMDFRLPELAEPMREWYNGYSFGGHVIYNPWSVINCIDSHPDPVGPQWLNTSSNLLIYEELQAGGLDLKRDLEKLLAGEELRYPITESTTFSDVGKSKDTIWSFLYFCGYLRAEDPQRDLLTGNLSYRISIPNLEVQQAYREFVRYWHHQLKFNSTEDLLRALVTCDLYEFERMLRDLTLSLYSCHDVSRYPEAAYHSLMLGLLANLRLAYDVASNVESGYGRADIILRPKTEAYPLAFVIEFKSANDTDDLETVAQDALQQIENRAYVTQLLEAGIDASNIRRLSIVFSSKQVIVRQAPN